MAMRWTLVMIVLATASCLGVAAVQDAAQAGHIAKPLEQNLSVLWRFDTGG